MVVQVVPNVSKVVLREVDSKYFYLIESLLLLSRFLSLSFSFFLSQRTTKKEDDKADKADDFDENTTHTLSLSLSLSLSSRDDDFDDDVIITTKRKKRKVSQSRLVQQRKEGGKKRVYFFFFSQVQKKNGRKTRKQWRNFLKNNMVGRLTSLSFFLFFLFLCVSSLSLHTNTHFHTHTHTHFHTHTHTHTHITHTHTHTHTQHTREETHTHHTHTHTVHSSQTHTHTTRATHTTHTTTRVVVVVVRTTTTTTVVFGKVHSCGKVLCAYRLAKTQREKKGRRSTTFNSGQNGAAHTREKREKERKNDGFFREHSETAETGGILRRRGGRERERRDQHDGREGEGRKNMEEIWRRDGRFGVGNAHAHKTTEEVNIPSTSSEQKLLTPMDLLNASRSDGGGNVTTNSGQQMAPPPMIRDARRAAPNVDRAAARTAAAGDAATDARHDATTRTATWNGRYEYVPTVRNG